MLSRLAGLVRQRALNHFLGLGAEADVFLAAFRIPNVLQNLFGEGSLSASFIPVYSRLLAAGDRDGARAVAGAVAGLLGVLVSALVLLGVLAAPWLVGLIAPGFSGDTRDLTIQLVRIVFPGTGILVLGAWTLGILNSHGRFFLSYAAPVAWNAVIIAVVLIAGPRTDAARLATLAALGALAGSAAQVLVMWPSARRAAGGVRPSLDRRQPGVREVGRTFVPAVLQRGVAQVSAWVDAMIASLLPTGAVAGLLNAQLLYTLPVSLFGISVAAAELPAMASATGADGDPGPALRDRLRQGMSRIAFFVVPSAAAFLGLGHLVAGLVFQSGAFGATEARLVWAILGGSAIGLLAGTFSRLLASACYALGDTRTPFRIAAVRVALAIVAGYLAAMHGPQLLGVAPRWGVAGLSAASGLAAWVEFTLLRRTLRDRIGLTGLPAGRLARLWGAAAGGMATAWGLLLLVPLPGVVWIESLIGLGAFGLVYLVLTRILGIPEAAGLASGLRRGIV